MMLTHQQKSLRRAGVATVEAAVVLTFLVVPLMIGVWEIGRLVYAQQVVATAAREGARVAAQGRTINSDGTLTLISISTGTPNVKDTVFQSLATGGLPTLVKADVNTTFTFITGSATEPYQAQKNDRFRVTVTIPFAKVRWVSLGIVNPTDVYYQVDWQMLNDDPFTISPNLPTW